MSSRLQRPMLAIVLSLVCFGALACSHEGSPADSLPDEETSPPPTPVSTSWMPEWMHTKSVSVVDGGTARVEVGNRIVFRGADDVSMSLRPESLEKVTFYGSDMSLLALHTGRVGLLFPNFDKNFDCDDGPCAHPNVPLEMTLVVTAGGPPAAIPDPKRFTPNDWDRTVELVPGQRLTVPEWLGFEADTDVPADVVAGIDSGFVALTPGTIRYELFDNRSRDVEELGALTIHVTTP